MTFPILVPIYKLPSKNILQSYTKLHSNQQYLTNTEYYQVFLFLPTGGKKWHLTSVCIFLRD